MISLQQICRNCDQRPFPCSGTCLCKANNQPILDNIECGSCPLDKFNQTAIEAEKRRPKNEVDKSFIFHELWDEIHNRAVNAPTLTSEIEWLNKAADRLPCGKCREDFKQLLIEFPPDLSSRENYFVWGHALHNRINLKLNKPEFSLVDAAEKYKTSSLILDIAEAYRQAMRNFADSIEAYPNDGRFRGKGLVFVGGGPYTLAAIASLKIERFIGCTLPAEIWRLPNEPLEQWTIDAVKDLDVTFRVPVKKMDVAEGWPLKARALLESSFEEIVFHDSDSYDLRDPVTYFQSKEYKETGAIFWPDPLRFKLLPSVWRAIGMDYQDEPTFEAGQIIIDKRRHWKQLVLNDWMNQKCKYYYNLGSRNQLNEEGKFGQGVYGDKDIFHLAWRYLNAPYFLIPHEYKRIPQGVIHYGFAGRPAIVHRIHSKPTVYGKDAKAFKSNQYKDARDDSIPLEDVFYNIVEEIRNTIPIKIGSPEDPTMIKLWDDLHKWAGSGNLTKWKQKLEEFESAIPDPNVVAKWQQQIRDNKLETSSRYKACGWVYQRHIAINEDCGLSWETVCQIYNWIAVDACQVAPKIWLGSAAPAMDAGWLRRTKITAIHNVAFDVIDPDLGVPIYNSPLRDGKGNTQDQIKEATNLLIKLITDGKNVYLHCKGGYSRSVYILARALSRIENIDFNIVYNRIKEIRGPGADDRLKELYGI